VNDKTSKLITDALAHAQMTEVILALPNGVESQVGDRGSKLSGGQRQRLGIARALYTNPKLLVLDEATSSLDGLTEENVASSILQNRHITVVTIAHRLSTIKKADYVIYLNDGRVECVGTFEQVRQIIPDFETQITLMGIK
jgi:ABC-type multidrug transport system fused ATPase/permease subunit